MTRDTYPTDQEPPKLDIVSILKKVEECQNAITDLYRLTPGVMVQSKGWIPGFTEDREHILAESLKYFNKLRNHFLSMYGETLWDNSDSESVLSEAAYQTIEELSAPTEESEESEPQ